MLAPFKKLTRNSFLVAWLLFARLGQGAEAVDYNLKIDSLFQQHCMDCHSAQDPEGKLVLESFETLLQGGDSGPAIVPGNSQESLLVKFLEGRSGKEGKNQFMPPGKAKKLEPAEIAQIKAWIDAGALAPKVAKTGIAPTYPKIQPLAEPRKPANALAHSPRAKLIAIGRFASVELRSADTRAVVRSLPDHRGTVSALEFSPDGTHLFAGGGDAGIAGEVRQWNMADGKLVRTFSGHKDALYALALSPDGKTLATGSYDQKIKLWNIATGEELQTLTGHNGAVFGLAFRPDGKILASASADRTVKLWDVATGARRDTLSQSQKELYTVAFSPDGKHLVAGGADSRIRRWEISEQALEGSNRLLYSKFAHEGTILKLIFAADGQTLISSATDKTVKLWNPALPSEKLLLEPQPDWVPALTLASGDTLLVTGRLDGSLGFYEPGSGKKSELIQTAPAAKAPARKVPAKRAAAMKAAPKAAAVRLEPPGLQRGVSSVVRLAGDSLPQLSGVAFQNPKLSGELVEEGRALRLIAAEDLPRGAYDLTLNVAKGEPLKVKIYVDDLPQLLEQRGASQRAAQMVEQLPVAIWGTLAQMGEADDYTFSARAGQELVFDLSSKSIGSKASDPLLQLLDSRGVVIASRRGLAGNAEPLLAFKISADGNYTLRVSEAALGGAPESTYRISLGQLPVLTGWFPLGGQAGQEIAVQLFGHNLPAPQLTFKTGNAGALTLPLADDRVRRRRDLNFIVSPGEERVEKEPNNDLREATPISLPGVVNGRFSSTGPVPDPDLFSFEAKAGESWIIETAAARLGSPVDTKIEVLHPDGRPVERLLLQATRDSQINFRSIDSNIADVRVENWEEMELNEFLYMQGEVCKIFRMPQGPDSGFQFYRFGGKRRNYFDTSSTAHSVDEQCYIVQPFPPGSKLVANGLPVFPLPFANDDDGDRELGVDSRLSFTAPANGRYLLRVTDTRGHTGEDHAYRLMVRMPKAGFKVNLVGQNLSLGIGSGEEFSVQADRLDGFDGDIKIEIKNVPPGFLVTTPLVIQAGHLEANGTLFASEIANTVPPGLWSNVTVMATAEVKGKMVTQKVNNFGEVKVLGKPPLMVFIEPIQSTSQGTASAIPEIVIAPGQTIPAMLRVVRNGDTNLVSLDVKNLPHGVIVDNIGLSGVLIRAGETEREIFLTAAKWVPETDRLCHAGLQKRNAPNAQQTSPPVLLKVRRPSQQAGVSGR